jgi:hypothetical protein
LAIDDKQKKNNMAVYYSASSAIVEPEKKYPQKKTWQRNSKILHIC